MRWAQGRWGRGGALEARMRLAGREEGAGAASGGGCTPGEVAVEAAVGRSLCPGLHRLPTPSHPPVPAAPGRTLRWGTAAAAWWSRCQRRRCAARRAAAGRAAAPGRPCRPAAGRGGGVGARPVPVRALRAGLGPPRQLEHASAPGRNRNCCRCCMRTEPAASPLRLASAHLPAHRQRRLPPGKSCAHRRPPARPGAPWPAR